MNKRNRGLRQSHRLFDFLQQEIEQCKEPVEAIKSFQENSNNH